jgi:hypothetical protein
MTAEPKSIAGLTNVQRGEMHRVALRLRTATVTLSGWRLELKSVEGHGAITRAENGTTSYYRGEGVLLGASQERMAELWRALTAAAGEPESDSGLQLG